MAPAPAGTAAARARLDALQGQVKSEDAQVRQLKAKVDTLESNTQAARRALEERDRKIAELQRQLEGETGPLTGAGTCKGRVRASRTT